MTSTSRSSLPATSALPVQRQDPAQPPRRLNPRLAVARRSSGRVDTGDGRESSAPLMARKRKRGRAAAERTSTPGTRRRGVSDPAPGLPHWRWRTFPVFFAFVTGVLVASLVNPPDSNIGYAVQLAALAGFGYGLAHLFVTNVIVAGRLKRRHRAAERGESLPEDFEEELVYSGEESKDSRR
jgi:hypothetical protein